MENLKQELLKIKEMSTNALERTIILNAIAKKYNMFNSDVSDIYYNL